MGEENTEVTGTLENWVVYQVTDEEFIIWGNIHNDIHDRWEDGHHIHTSGIENRHVKEGDIIKTRNNSYLLGSERKSIL